LGAPWPRGHRVLQGRLWRGRDLSRGRYRRTPRRGRPALGWQRILLGFRRVTTEQELQPRIVGGKHSATVVDRPGSSLRGRAGRGPGRRGSLTGGRGTRLAAGTDRRPLRTSLGDRETTGRMATFTCEPWGRLSRDRLPDACP